MEKTAFVIMPFSDTVSCTQAQWTEIFEDIFRPAFSDLGYACERAKPAIGNLTGSIVDQLRTSRIVLADLTDRNPNVFYELGVRHTLRRGTIIVSQNDKHVPSDLRGYWFLTYGIRPAEVREFKTNIARLVKEFEASPQRSDNPVAEYLQKENLVVSDYAQRENLGKLSALSTEITGNISDLRRGGEYISFGCLELLLQTRYVDPGPEFLKDGYELWHLLKTLNSGIQNQELAKNAIQHLDQFYKAVSAIIESIRKGDFVESPSVSYMVWKPNAPDSSVEFGSTCTTSLVSMAAACEAAVAPIGKSLLSLRLAEEIIKNRQPDAETPKMHCYFSRQPLKESDSEE